MKCQYLKHIALPIQKSKRAYEVNNSTECVLLPLGVVDMVCCAAGFEPCPKKKQPCEINARCWSLGGK